jgi:reactive intermediate/imine deaminase
MWLVADRQGEIVAKSAIHPAGAKPVPVPLSPGIRKGNILQVAGQIPADPSTGEIVGSTVADQTRQSMRNVLGVLAAGGATMDDVVMVRIYLTDTAHFAEMNSAYQEFLTDPYPARTTVYVGLPAGLLVEIDALAVLD